MRISDWSSDVCSSDLMSESPSGERGHLLGTFVTASSRHMQRRFQADDNARLARHAARVWPRKRVDKPIASILSPPMKPHQTPAGPSAVLNVSTVASGRPMTPYAATVISIGTRVRSEEHT